MAPLDLKAYALSAVQAAAAKHAVAKFRDVSREVISPRFFDDRDLDRALQALRREGSIQYLGKRDPKTGKPRKRWGWQPVAKRGARRG